MTEPIRDSLDHCVKCTICETFCPFSQVTPLFPGPKYVGPQAERYRAAGTLLDASLDYCSGCGICTQVCPHDVKIAEINAQARSRMWEQRGIPLRNQLIARPSVLGRLGTPVAPLANWAFRARPVSRPRQTSVGIHRNAPMPRFVGRTSNAGRGATAARPPSGASSTSTPAAPTTTNRESARWSSPSSSTTASTWSSRRRTVAGCRCSRTATSTRRGRTCRRLVANLAPHVRDGLPIVSNSTSCGLMLKREAREILGVEDDDLKAVSEATYDLCEFLLLLHERGELETDFRPLPLSVPYHAPCEQQGTESASPRSTCSP